MRCMAKYTITGGSEYDRELREWIKYEAQRKSAESLEKWKKIYEEEQKNKQKK